VDGGTESRGYWTGTSTTATSFRKVIPVRSRRTRSTRSCSTARRSCASRRFVFNVSTKNHRMDVRWLARHLGPEYTVHAVEVADNHI
jgi:hypothetical protein